MAAASFDLAIVGGGINGCGIAREAAGRGYSVFLCEQGDLASATSSASTKLIHGGLRYLEHYEFRLVREALREREVLWRMAPHIVWPLRFVLPHHAGLRPAWLLRLGLFLYDHLGGRGALPGTRSVALREDPVGEPLRAAYTRAFEYSDCWVDDSRLVVLNAMDAASLGAEIRTRARLVEARREHGGWSLTIEPTGKGGATRIRAAALANAAGPWVGKVGEMVTPTGGAAKIRLVQGAHIVVPRLFAQDCCYIFQNVDGRIVFAIPYERDFTLIGTTDLPFEGDPADAAATAGEIDYLCRAVSEYFVRPVAPADVVWSFAGVRPLQDDGSPDAQSVTRDYTLALEAQAGQGALLTVYGGKITTFRRLAAAALDKLTPHLPDSGRDRPAWRSELPLPGGDFPIDGVPALVAALQREYPFLAPEHVGRLVRAYGTRASAVLDGARAEADLGRRFGADLTEREVTYLMRHEWAASAEDVVWRRSKLGLRMAPTEIAGLDAWMAARPHGAAASAAGQRAEATP